jgi:hypothetical protein
MFVYWMRFSPRTHSDIIFFEWPLLADSVEKVGQVFSAEKYAREIEIFTLSR